MNAAVPYSGQNLKLKIDRAREFHQPWIALSQITTVRRRPVILVRDVLNVDPQDHIFLGHLEAIASADIKTVPSRQSEGVSLIGVLPSSAHESGAQG